MFGDFVVLDLAVLEDVGTRLICALSKLESSSEHGFERCQTVEARIERGDDVSVHIEHELVAIRKA